MTKVIYIMGAGRSGSTILGVALGNCAGVFYAGELDAWLRKCGEPSYPSARTSAFWTAVRESLREHRDLCGDETLRCLEHSAAVLPSRRRRAEGVRGRYRDFSRELYGTVAELSGCGAVVDSSHYPLRARELRGTEGLDVYLVLLTRDPHAVVQSFGETEGEGRKGLWAANVYLWVTHLISTLVYVKHPRQRRLRVSYEDFVGSPVTIVRKVLAMVGVDAPVPDTTNLDTGCALAGNRILRAERVALRSILADSPRRSLVTKILQAPWITFVIRPGPAWARRRLRGPLATDVRPEGR